MVAPASWKTRVSACDSVYNTRVKIRIPTKTIFKFNYPSLTLRIVNALSETVEGLARNNLPEILKLYNIYSFRRLLFRTSEFYKILKMHKYFELLLCQLGTRKSIREDPNFHYHHKATFAHVVF